MKKRNNMTSVDMKRVLELYDGGIHDPKQLSVLIGVERAPAFAIINLLTATGRGASAPRHRAPPARGIGVNVQEHRLRMGLTVPELAERLGAAYATTRAIENGNHVPSLQLLRRLANCFGVSVTDLLKGTEYA